MKRSKFLMGFTALMFAAIGAFATTSRAINPVWYMSVDGDQTTCTILNQNFACEEEGVGCEGLTPSGLRPLFGDNGCNQTLKPEGTF